MSLVSVAKLSNALTASNNKISQHQAIPVSHCKVSASSEKTIHKVVSVGCENHTQHSNS